MNKKVVKGITVFLVVVMVLSMFASLFWFI